MNTHTYSLRAARYRPELHALTRLGRVGSIQEWQICHLDGERRRAPLQLSEAGVRWLAAKRSHGVSVACAWLYSCSGTHVHLLSCSCTMSRVQAASAVYEVLVAACTCLGLVGVHSLNSLSIDVCHGRHVNASHCCGDSDTVAMTTVQAVDVLRSHP